MQAQSFLKRHGTVQPQMASTPSPFAQFSSATMEEHHLTLERLAAQLEMIARALSDLDGEDIRHNHEHSRTIESLSREQDELVRRIFQCGEMSNACIAHLREEEARIETQVSSCEKKQNDLTNELRQLEDLEQQMIELEHSARERLMLTQNQISEFTQALRDGLAVLETDAKEVRRIVTSAGRALSADPISTASAIAGASARLPVDHTAFGFRTALPSAVPRAELIRRDVEDRGSIVSPERKGRQARFMRSATEDERTVTKVFQQEEPSLYGESTLTIPGADELLEACARVPMDPNEVTFLLRQNQAAVNALDRLDNTPLHLACMNPNPSIDAVHALLLAGSNASLKNSSGLTPFHLACLNHRGDPLHSLKRFLIFKGAQNPNQRTSRGETAAHLCAEDDKHFDSLVFLIGAGVDAAVPALLPGHDGATRQMNSLDVARAGGSRSQRNLEFLRSNCI